ncbi:MAG: saccharopine dehydrogenase NADP-binding domain-containing protein [Solirubrobacteraceae bacterium]|nr:saccharopine dehydrogenase NADP-binding domain-containing protein [Solirubrobacteraceae bacterium]
MGGQIVVFGATGYTGDLAARALVRMGARPVLAARSEPRVRALAQELGDLEYRVADVDRPESVAAIVGAGDVLLSTVGPFTKWGRPAVEAAIAGGAHYLDSTGEGPFIRSIFEEFGPRAEATGVGLLTAFGYDFVPGNLAGGIALAEAGDRAASVQVGYYMTGKAGKDAMSGGTAASALGVIAGRGFAWRDGRITDERVARGVVTLRAGGRDRQGITVSGSEHFALPRLAPGLREVEVGLGWLGPASRAAQVVSAVAAPVTGSARGQAALGSVVGRFVKGSTGGPDEAARAKTGSIAVAVARDAGGAELAHVELAGPNGYTLTGDLLAWGAIRAVEGGLQGTGALGPVDGFGLDELRDGCASIGLTRRDS